MIMSGIRIIIIIIIIIIVVVVVVIIIIFNWLLQSLSDLGLP
jgi:hypothetical protein